MFCPCSNASFTYAIKVFEWWCFDEPYYCLAKVLWTGQTKNSILSLGCPWVVWHFTDLWPPQCCPSIYSKSREVSLLVIIGYSYTPLPDKLSAEDFSLFLDQALYLQQRLKKVTGTRVASYNNHCKHVCKSYVGWICIYLRALVPSKNKNEASIPSFGTWTLLILVNVTFAFENRSMSEIAKYWTIWFSPNWLGLPGRLMEIMENRWKNSFLNCWKTGWLGLFYQGHRGYIFSL